MLNLLTGKVVIIPVPLRMSKSNATLHFTNTWRHLIQMLRGSMENYSKSPKLRPLLWLYLQLVFEGVLVFHLRDGFFQLGS